MKKFIYMVLAVLVSAGCAKQAKPYDQPFAYVALEGDLTLNSSSTVPSRINDVVRSYVINLSSATPDKAVTVDYEISVGSGLKEGVDYELVNPSKSVKFLPGVFATSVKIRYLRNTLDPKADNTITITLTGSSDPRMVLGFPGPAHKNISHTITKFNN